MTSLLPILVHKQFHSGSCHNVLRCVLMSFFVYACDVRYKRFLRSKDLSVVSSADLDCVLGRKKRKLTDKPPDNEHVS